MALLASDRGESPIHSAEIASALLGGSTEFCVLPRDRAPALSERSGSKELYRQTRGGGAGREIKGDERRDPGDWPPAGVNGGDVMPIRTVFDPYPTFDAVAVDADAGRAFFTDSSLSSLLSYSTTAGGNSSAITESETRVLGPDSGIGFIAGAEVVDKPFQNPSHDVAIVLNVSLGAADTGCRIVQTGFVHIQKLSKACLLGETIVGWAENCCVDSPVAQGNEPLRAASGGEKDDVSFRIEATISESVAQ